MHLRRCLVPSFAALVSILLAACAGVDIPRDSGEPVLTPEEGRALVRRAVPDAVKDRAGWATDIYAALASLDLRVNVTNVCAVVAVIGQESGFVADPAVPGLPALARKEIDRRREAAHVPAFAVTAVLALPSGNGRTYGERLDDVRTERELSELYEDFIGRVPLGKTLLADRNPVRTGGPMQVSVAFAEAFAGEHAYPYPVATSLRREVFTRRGGIWFGTAHLLDYPVDYPRMLFRFADYNAGHYASRNAAFQQAVVDLSGVPLALDGDLLRYTDGAATAEPGSTERALRTLARRLDLDEAAIRRDLLREKQPDFVDTRLYVRVFALADAAAGKPAPRAVVPAIPLTSPKITRQITTEWFATRVDARYEACRKRVAAPAAS